MKILIDGIRESLICNFCIGETTLSIWYGTRDFGLDNLFINNQIKINV